MTWLLTHTGREHHLTHAAHPDNIPTIAEIAWSLAHINRYTGHTCRAYSVAEHSLLVADYAHAIGANKIAELLCLMHDAHECIVGDVSSPVKQMLGSGWKVFEHYHQRGLLMGYDLWDEFQNYASLVKHCDLVALATERRDLTAYNAGIHTPWPVIDTPGNVLLPWTEAALMQPSHVLRTPRQWATKFEHRAETLFAAIQPTNPL
jgi:hypothetical protein